MCRPTQKCLGDTRAEGPIGTDYSPCKCKEPQLQDSEAPIQYPYTHPLHTLQINVYKTKVYKTTRFLVYKTKNHNVSEDQERCRVCCRDTKGRVPTKEHYIMAVN